MKAELEIVMLDQDVVTVSGEPTDCECYVIGYVSNNMTEDDC